MVQKCEDFHRIKLKNIEEELLAEAYKDNDVYDKENDLLDDDEINAREEGFMSGYLMEEEEE